MLDNVNKLGRYCELIELENKILYQALIDMSGLAGQGPMDESVSRELREIRQNIKELLEQP